MVVFSVDTFNHEPSPNEPAPHPLAMVAMVISPRLQPINDGYHQQWPPLLVQHIVANQQVSFVLILILILFFTTAVLPQLPSVYFWCIDTTCTPARLQAGKRVCLRSTT